MAVTVEELPGSAGVGLDGVGGVDVNQLPSDRGVGGTTAENPVNIVVTSGVGAEEGIREEGGSIRIGSGGGVVDSVVAFFHVQTNNGSRAGVGVDGSNNHRAIGFAVDRQF